MSLAETVFNTPVLLAALTVVVLAVVRYQRGMSWPEYRAVHRLKVRLAVYLDRRTDIGVSLVNAKGLPENDDEFVRHDDRSLKAVATDLVRAGGSYHLVNSIKVRRPESGPQYSAAHVVFFHDDGTQTEVYLFRALDGQGVDVYAHHETAVTDPDGHILKTEQVDGDPRGVLDRV